MAPAQLARVEAMARVSELSSEDRAALTALLAERTALREALGSLYCHWCEKQIDQSRPANGRACAECADARAALGGTA